LEEAEHAAVSNDQYLYFFGDNYWHRLYTTWRAIPIFTMLNAGIKVTAKGMGHKITLRDRLQLFRYMWINPGPMRGLCLKILQYILPWYKLSHTHEDMEQMQRWNDELYAGLSTVDKTAA